MTSPETESLINSEADLIARTGYSGDTPIEDWLGDLCEFADNFDDAGDETCFGITMFHHPYRGCSSQYTVQLSYPFPLAALEAEAERAELYFRGTMEAAGLKDGATIGVPESEDDVTAELAGNVMGSDTEEVSAALGGEWFRLDFDVDLDASGELIYAWFVPSDDRMVALGVGAGALYVVPLLGSEAEGFEVEEWPMPAISLWWAGAWADGLPQGDPADTVVSLREAIKMVAASPAGATSAG